MRGGCFKATASAYSPSLLTSVSLVPAGRVDLALRLGAAGFVVLGGLLASIFHRDHREQARILHSEESSFSAMHFARLSAVKRASAESTAISICYHYISLLSIFHIKKGPS